MTNKKASHSRLGRAWFGGSTRTLVLLSITAGVLLGNGLAALILLAHEPTHAGATYFFSILAGIPFFTLIAWTLLVDTNTLWGAKDPQEDSIERAWGKEAGYQAFLAMITVCIAATLVFTFTEIVIATTTVLWAVILLGGGVYGIHYYRLKQGES
ncbi:MAG: hypothetical protein GX596_14400 [Propionibacterium sp.]|nr:hypothetical protein [Propionibacterium sp.]